MKRLALTAILVIAWHPVQAQSPEEYPRPPELVAAQAEIDALIASAGSRSKMDSGTQARLDAAIETRNSALDARNSEWEKQDRTSMFKAQVETCNNVRKRISQGSKITDIFDDLRYAGFSTDETLDIVLQIENKTPQIGKSVRVAFCILGLPDDRVRTESRHSRTVMFVYPHMFVHAEDGVVTSWSDR